MVKSNRFRKRTSDRSGFDYLERELIRDKGSLVGSDERDNPPPSNISLGGEGDISTGEFFRSSTSTDIDPNYENPTFYITALDGISPSFTHPYMRVTGSNSAITITANPSILASQEGNILTLFCTDSSITITNGNGVSLMGSATLRLDSGSTVNFMFNTANNAWNETSRTSSDFGIGG